MNQLLLGRPVEVLDRTADGPRPRRLRAAVLDEFLEVVTDIVNRRAQLAGCFGRAQRPTVAHEAKRFRAHGMAHCLDPVLGGLMAQEPFRHVVLARSFLISERLGYLWSGAKKSVRNLGHAADVSSKHMCLLSCDGGGMRMLIVSGRVMPTQETGKGS
jgi:hypothetical protein